MKRIAVYAGSREVYPCMVTAAKSLVSSTAMDEVWFLTEDDDFPEQLPPVIHTRNMIGQTWFYADGPNYFSHWTYMAMMRLVLPEIFPDVDRILYLDCDTLVLRDIGELFEIDLHGRLMGAVAEPLKSRPWVSYYNAGVLLMDLAMLRDSHKQAEMVRMINAMKFSFPDQDVLNACCLNQIFTLNPTYNSNRWTMNAQNPHIVHFAADPQYRKNPLWMDYEAREWRVKDARESESRVPVD